MTLTTLLPLIPLSLIALFLRQIVVLLEEIASKSEVNNPQKEATVDDFVRMMVNSGVDVPTVTRKVKDAMLSQSR
jgi:hypothetical protein